MRKRISAGVYRISMGRTDTGLGSLVVWGVAFVSYAAVSIVDTPAVVGGGTVVVVAVVVLNGNDDDGGNDPDALPIAIARNACIAIVAAVSTSPVVDTT